MQPPIRLIPVTKWARECGISKAEAYQRVRKGQIPSMKHPHKRQTLVVWCEPARPAEVVE